MNPEESEPLELLLPKEGAPSVERARRVANFARLLVADARRDSVATGPAELERARGELERQSRAERSAVLEDLLRHHLGACLGGESFMDAGPPQEELGVVWRRELEADPPSLAPPAPGESALEVARRAVEIAERAELAPERIELWRARLARAEGGARAGEACFLDALGLADERAPLSLRRELLAGLIECLLDRGAVREASVRLADSGRLVKACRRLRVLAAWCALLLDEPDAARAALEGLRPWDGKLPDALCELRAERGELAPFLTGRAGPRAVGGLGVLPLERRAFGASVLAWFRPDSSGIARPVSSDLAPGLRQAAERWIEEREDVLAVPGTPEQRLVLEALPVRRYRDDGRALKGALGGDRTLALLLEPVLDAEGELAGWLHLEFEHRLLPTPRRARALARAAATRPPHELRDPRAASIAGAVRETVSRAGRLEELESPAREMLSAVFEALVSELGIRTQARRCIGIDLAHDEPRIAARIGEAFDDGGAPGGGRALARALAAGGVAGFDEPDARLALHRDAASGLVIPLSLRGRCVGALVIESSRRRDFRSTDLERLQRQVALFAPALRAAQFRARHLEEEGCDLFLDTSSAGFRGFCEQLVLAARSSAPVVLSGESGTGRTALARWLHFESEHAQGRLAVERAGPNATIDLAEGGNQLIEELDELSEADQLRLLERLDAGRSPRLFATLSRPLAEAVERGGLRPELAARLGRLELFVPPLRERREELPGLVEFLFERLAEEERTHRPRLTDGALALLWRQPWSGNLRELEAFAFKLVLMHPGEEIDELALRGLARRFRFPLAGRLPSRHPDRRDLVAALRTTRLGTGRTNKRRAAQFLGWDPDTLAARVREAGLDEDSAVCEPSPWEAPEG